ncbi:MAG: hypothetical protein HKN04_05345 [Rhodothermaceae bacterium]|nr:hypothetical protein [Rhodothermaceae bacterium]
MRVLLACTLLLTLAACTAETEPPPGSDEAVETVESSAPPAVVAEADEMNTLDAGDEVPIEMVFTQFVEAVRTGDAEKVADFVRFPLAGAEVPDRTAFVRDFYPHYLGEHDQSFTDIITDGSPEDLVAYDDGRYYFMALDEGDCADEPECSGAAMIFYFAPEGETWQINEIQFAG